MKRGRCNAGLPQRSLVVACIQKMDKKPTTSYFGGYLSMILLCFTSCLPHPGKLSKLPHDIATVQHKQTIILPQAANKTMTIQYLGAGGLYLLNNKEGILIDPFFSNQKVGRLAISVLCDKNKVRANEKYVDYGLKAIEDQTGALAPQVMAIFSAHSHFDHLLDVPAVFEKLGKQLMVYLNQSGYNICYHVIDKHKMEVLEAHMTTAETESPRLPIVLPTATGKVHVYPILADHNPHFKHIKAFDGDVTMPNTTFKQPYDKTKANDWLEGNTFSFVIDYVNGAGAIELRLFIQSSSCNPMAGIPPMTVPEHKVDIAFLGVASYEASPQYPAALLKAFNPSAIVWIHWEDFFRKYTRKPKTVRATDVPAFFDIVEVKAVRNIAYLPWPRAVFEVKY